MGFVFVGITAVRCIALNCGRALLLDNVRSLMCHERQIRGAFAGAKSDIAAVGKRSR